MKRSLVLSPIAFLLIGLSCCLVSCGQGVHSSSQAEDTTMTGKLADSIPPTDGTGRVSAAAPETTVAPLAQTATPTALPDYPVDGYRAYVVQPGDSMETIAASGGSEAGLVRQYNHVAGPLLPGCPLIVPHIAGRHNTLPDTPMTVRRGCTERPWVAITLDDCLDAKNVTRILAALRERDVHITFFLTGWWLQKHPDLAQQIAADGHEMSSHSYSHSDFVKLTDAQVIDEITQTERLLQEAVNQSSRPFFRIPFGGYDGPGHISERVERLVIGQGYLPIGWTVDGQDAVYGTKSAAYMLESMTSTLPPEQMQGAIILGHCSSNGTAEALPAILDRFDQMGFEVHSLGEVLGMSHKNVLPIQQTEQTEQTERCFAETGFCIIGRMQQFWEQNGGVKVFGYPISPQQEETVEGRPMQVQWFQRARLEMHPENDPPYDVMLSRLGATLYQPGEPAGTHYHEADCLIFPETGFPVCGAFLKMWKTHGLEFDGQPAGITLPERTALFGLPISGEELRVLPDGSTLVVQWFERVRLEYHPEDPSRYHVLAGLLGQEYLEANP